jgi:uracil-DNA glycosylase family 4
MTVPWDENIEIMPEPPANCRLCPRLLEFRQENQNAFPDFFNAPVPSFGDENARLLIVGLAPGLKGANWSGRPFTGDAAGIVLYEMLEKFGLSRGSYQARADDGLELCGVMISNAVRCVPPQNKPLASEINSCRPFLARRIQSLPELRIILALGRIAHDSVIKSRGLRLAAFPFGHKAIHRLDDGLLLIDSYHCSRYNMNTRRLTTEMFADVFRVICARLDGGRSGWGRD